MTRGADTLHWRVRSHIDKYDPDQVGWVRRRSGIVAPSGDLFTALGVKPSDVSDGIGNLLTTAGLNRLTSLLIAGGGQGLTNTATRLGAGNSSTAAAVGQTDLQASAGSSNRQFKVMDATYPQQSNGVVTAKSTFPTGEGNFPWAEWCLDVGTPTVSDGTTVNALMFNRKVESNGTKASGAVWAFTVTVTIA